MDITQIPFNKYINITQSTTNENTLELAFENNKVNHIGTLHASAQFALAEACSGLALQKHFPEYADNAVPVLRKTETKFKKPASSNIKAQATISDEELSKFKEVFEKKSRATIPIQVQVTSDENTITMVGTYEWFVQKI